MYKQIIFCCFIVLAVLSSSEALKNQCKEEEDLLQRCSVALPVLSSPTIEMALTREELDKNCIELKAGIKCIDNYTDYCMDAKDRFVFRKIYVGITEVVRDLCTRGEYQDEYLKHAPCVVNVRQDYEVCSKKYEVTLTTLSNPQKQDQYQTERQGQTERHGHVVNDNHQQHHNHEDNLRTVCCSFREYLSCSERVVQGTCGDEAAQFTSHFLKRMASNIIKSFCLDYSEEECRSHDDGAAVSNQSTFLTTALVIAHLILYLMPA